MIKEITKNRLKGHLCEDCWCYSEIFFIPKQDAERIIKNFKCKLEIFLDDYRICRIRLPENLGCDEFESDDDD